MEAKKNRNRRRQTKKPKRAIFNEIQVKDDMGHTVMLLSGGRNVADPYEDGAQIRFFDKAGNMTFGLVSTAARQRGLIVTGPGSEKIFIGMGIGDALGVFFEHPTDVVNVVASRDGNLTMLTSDVETLLGFRRPDSERA